jgi:hypothetical protein
MKSTIRKQDIPGLVVCTILGLGLTFLGAVKIKNASETRSWPVTKGKITVSEVKGAMKYYPSVSYTYSIDSIDYSSNGITLMNYSTKKRSVVEETLKKYPLGSEVKVYYNSADPAKAFLEPGITTGNFILLAVGILLLAIPVGLIIFMKKPQSA